MIKNKPFRSINANGKLLSFDKPCVMGILNITPDSFYAVSRKQDEEEIRLRVESILNDGAAIIDVGAYSSRPGATPVPEGEEANRLKKALAIIANIAPEAIVSVDTFRADIARMCVEEYGVAIINDISGGMLDSRMFGTVARLGVPYIMMHMQGTPQTMQDAPRYDNLLKDIFMYFAKRIDSLLDLGAKDIIIDPGFGFGKTLADNYEILNHLEEFQTFGLPLLVGVSRKSMIYKLLGGSPEAALNGTTAINMISLMKGADILRVHDVKEAVEAVKIFCKTEGL